METVEAIRHSLRLKEVIGVFSLLMHSTEMHYNKLEVVGPENVCRLLKFFFLVRDSGPYFSAPGWVILFMGVDIQKT